MRIVVKNRIDERNSVQIFFESEIGSGNGAWKSKGVQPVTGESYDVEFEIPEILEWGVSIFKCETKKFSISSGEGCVNLMGKLESVDGSSVATIRVCDDIILVETSGDFEAFDGYVIVKSPQLNLYDINL
jgi:hypothetical protein